jgi:hypothetical protein
MERRAKTFDGVVPQAANAIGPMVPISSSALYPWFQLAGRQHSRQAVALGDIVVVAIRVDYRWPDRFYRPVWLNFMLHIRH